MLRIFNANYFYNYLLFPIVGALLLLPAFLSPGTFELQPAKDINPLLLPLYAIIKTKATALFLNYLAVMVISVLFLYISSTFSFVGERSFLPVYLFMFIALAHPSTHNFQPVFIAAIFMQIAIINLLASFEKAKVIANGFNAGFFTGIAGLFYPALSCLFFLAPMSLYSLKNKVGWREWTASVIGLLLPHIYVFSYFYLTNNLNSFYSIYLQTFAPKNLSKFAQLPTIVHLVFITIISIAASITMLRHYGEKKINTRRFYKIVLQYLFFGLLLLSIPSISYELLIIVSLPLSFILTNYLTFIRCRIWAEAIFMLIIIFSVALQFLVK